VTIVVPRDSETVWAAIENLVRKGISGDFSAGSFENENQPEEKVAKLWKTISAATASWKSICGRMDSRCGQTSYGTWKISSLGKF
jgi:hypothetical protein